MRPNNIGLLLVLLLAWNVKWKTAPLVKKAVSPAPIAQKEGSP